MNRLGDLKELKRNLLNEEKQQHMKRLSVILGRMFHEVTTTGKKKSLELFVKSMQGRSLSMDNMKSNFYVNKQIANRINELARTDADKARIYAVLNEVLNTGKAGMSINMIDTDDFIFLRKNVNFLKSVGTRNKSLVTRNPLTLKEFSKVVEVFKNIVFDHVKSLDENTKIKYNKEYDYLTNVTKSNYHQILIDTVAGSEYDKDCMLAAFEYIADKSSNVRVKLDLLTTDERKALVNTVKDLILANKVLGVTNGKR